MPWKPWSAQRGSTVEHALALLRRGAAVVLLMLPLHAWTARAGAATGSLGAASESSGHWGERRKGDPTRPPAAEDCAMIYDPVRHRLVLSGGKNDEDQILNEVWEFDLNRNRWRQLETHGPQPLPREDHVAIFDPIGYRMLIHGGENDTPVSNEIWALDLRSLEWTDLTTADSPAREDHTAIYDERGKRMILFGGRRDSGETWSFALDPAAPDFEHWRNLTPPAPNPPGRVDHVAVYDGLKNRMLIHGGWDKNKKQYFDDTWAYHLPVPPDTLGHWEALRTGAMHPPKRRHATGVLDASQNRFIVFGGTGEEGYSNAVWVFDLTADVWSDRTPGPQPRIDHQAVFDPRSRTTLVYGGDGIRSGKLHAVWELQLDVPSTSEHHE